MTERDQEQRERFVRIIAFSAQHADNFPEGKIAAKHLSELKEVVAKFDELAGRQSQSSGAGRASTTTKHSLVLAVRADIVGLGRVARALESERPGLSQQFRTPASESDEAQLTAGRAALDTLNADPSLVTLFVDYGMPADFVDDLGRDIQAADEADAAQDEHTGARREDTLAIAEVIQKGTMATEKLDAYAQNIYRDNRVLLGAWKSASHLERKRVHPKPAK